MIHSSEVPAIRLAGMLKGSCWLADMHLAIICESRHAMPRCRSLRLGLSSPQKPGQGAPQYHGKSRCGTLRSCQVRFPELPVAQRTREAN
jgi:hypothetical protein